MDDFMEVKKVLFFKENAIINVEEYKEYIYLDSILVHDEHRNKGLGTEILLDIIEYSEIAKKPLLAFATHELGGDIERLMIWYKKHGFYEEWNKLRTESNYNIRRDS